MLAAGDTVCAAAVEQLQAWGQRNNVPVIAQSQGSDAARRWSLTRCKRQKLVT